MEGWSEQEVADILGLRKVRKKTVFLLRPPTRASPMKLLGSTGGTVLQIRAGRDWQVKDREATSFFASLWPRQEQPARAQPLTVSPHRI